MEFLGPSCYRSYTEDMGNRSLSTRAKGCTKCRAMQKNDPRIRSVYQCDFDLLQLLKEKTWF